MRPYMMVAYALRYEEHEIPHGSVRRRMVLYQPSYLTVVFGVAGLIAAAGLWMLKRWALWLSIAVCLLGGIFSWAPVIPQAPSALHRGLAAVVVVGSVLIIVLVVLPSSRRAYA